MLQTGKRRPDPYKDSFVLGHLGYWARQPRHRFGPLGGGRWTVVCWTWCVVGGGSVVGCGGMYVDIVLDHFSRIF